MFRHSSFVIGRGRFNRPKARRGERKLRKHCNPSQGDCEIQFKGLRFSFVSIDQIKEAIGQLSFAERAELAAWLHGWKDDDWDEQMKRDIANGKLDHVLREIDEDIRLGRPQLQKD